MFRAVFWVILLIPDDGGSTHLWNVGRQSFYTAVYPRRQLWTSYFLCCLTYFEGQKNQPYRANCCAFWLEEAQIVQPSALFPDGWKVILFCFTCRYLEMTYLIVGMVTWVTHHSTDALRYTRLLIGQVKTCTSQTLYFALPYAVTQMNLSLVHTSHHIQQTGLRDRSLYSLHRQDDSFVKTNLQLLTM
jgi:hypothetical protein